VKRIRRLTVKILPGLATIAIVSIAVSGNASAKPQSCGPADAQPGAALTCAVPGFDRRPYNIHLPANYDFARPVPVVLAIHGGGGRARGAARTSCPGGDIDSLDCLHAMAAREGVAVVYPNGTSSRLLRRVRTWNAGGGTGEWQCVSGRACKDGVDDIAYFRALFDDLARWVAVDPARIYATGLSNGGAMSHRLACEMADRVAAIAPLGGANQFAATAVCAPSRPIPVLQIHGTADPCWRYEGGPAACAQRDDKMKIAVAESMRVWAAINGCGPAEEPEIFASEDRVETMQIRWTGCRDGAETILLRMEGGGHVWPGGWAYFREGIIGPMVGGWSANRAILDFFRRHRLPEYR
jgi:polyhydroxybutyrate depolymerase